MANKITKSTKAEIAEINEKIARVNDLIDEISRLGWDIHSYLQKKYKEEGYEYDESVIPDPHDSWIARQASQTGMINTYNEFGFGDNRLDPDGLKHDSRYYEPTYKLAGYFNDWDDILSILKEGRGYAYYMYANGLGSFHSIDDEEVYRKSDMEKRNTKVYEVYDGLERWDIDHTVHTEWLQKGLKKVTPRDNCFVDIYVPIKKNN